MMEITQNTYDNEVINAVMEFLELAKRSKNADLTISISKDSIPTLSYKIDGMHLIGEGE